MTDDWQRANPAIGRTVDGDAICLAAALDVAGIFTGGAASFCVVHGSPAP